MEQRYTFVKASILKRIFSTCVDLFLWMIISLLLFIFVLTPIYDKTSNINALTSSYNEMLVSTHLYEYDENNSPTLITSNYEEHLSYFYENFKSLDDYYELKSSSPSCFTYDEITSSYIAIGDEETMNRFYISTLQIACNELNNLEPFASEGEKITYLSLQMLVISLLISGLVTILLPSICIKGGRTLGMLVFSIRTISRSKSPEPSKVQILSRFVVFLGVETILSLYTLFLPVIITICMILFTKDNYSLNDYITSTSLVEATIIDKSDSSKSLSILYESGDKEEC